MKHIKPGRGPSMMGGIMAIFAAVFGLFWMGMAASIGAGPFALFGLFFIAIAISSAVYNFKNATQKNRYSMYDITSSEEEPDPLNEHFGEDEPRAQTSADSRFCPYCGTALQEDFVFCNICGKKLPK